MIDTYTLSIRALVKVQAKNQEDAEIAAKELIVPFSDDPEFEFEIAGEEVTDFRIEWIDRLDRTVDGIAVATRLNSLSHEPVQPETVQSYDVLVDIDPSDSNTWIKCWVHNEDHTARTQTATIRKYTHHTISGLPSYNLFYSTNGKIYYFATPVADYAAYNAEDES